MTLQELKQEIEQRTGVPAVLLTGETAEENIAQAKAVLAYKREMAAKQPAQRKTAREEFKDLFQEHFGSPEQDKTGEILAEIEEKVMLDAGYPIINDGGEVSGAAQPTAKEQFKTWIGNQTAYDPFKRLDGWHHLR